MGAGGECACADDRRCQVAACSASCRGERKSGTALPATRGGGCAEHQKQRVGLASLTRLHQPMGLAGGLELNDGACAEIHPTQHCTRSISAPPGGAVRTRTWFMGRTSLAGTIRGTRGGSEVCTLISGAPSPADTVKTSPGTHSCASAKWKRGAVCGTSCRPQSRTHRLA